MRRVIIFVWLLAVMSGASAGLLWVQAAGDPAPVTELRLAIDAGGPVVHESDFIALSAEAQIVGGPAVGLLTLTVSSQSGQSTAMEFTRSVRQDGYWLTSIPTVPVPGYGTGFLEATLTAGGRTVSRKVALTVTGGDFDVTLSGPQDRLWEDLPQFAGQPHLVTLTAAVANDSNANGWPRPTYTYEWRAVTNPRTGQALRLVAGGSWHDATATYAAPPSPAGSSQPYVVSCEVISEGMWDENEALGATTLIVVGPATVTAGLDRTWVYQNTPVTTGNRHRAVLSVAVTGPTSYTVSVSQSGGDGAVVIQPGADQLTWNILGGPRQAGGRAGIGAATLNVAVTDAATGEVATTEVTVTVRQLGDIDGQGGVSGQDKLLLNKRLNGLVPNGPEYDLDGQGGCSGQDKLVLNKILSGLAIP